MLPAHLVAFDMTDRVAGVGLVERKPGEIGDGGQGGREGEMGGVVGILLDVVFD